MGARAHYTQPLRSHIHSHSSTGVQRCELLLVVETPMHSHTKMGYTKHLRPHQIVLKNWKTVWGPGIRNSMSTEGKFLVIFKNAIFVKLVSLIKRNFRILEMEIVSPDLDIAAIYMYRPVSSFNVWQHASYKNTNKWTPKTGGRSQQTDELNKNSN